METARAFLIDQIPSYNHLFQYTWKCQIATGKLVQIPIGAAALTSIPGRVSAGEDGDFSLPIIHSPALNPEQGKKSEPKPNFSDYI